MAECRLPEPPIHEENIFRRNQYVQAVLDAAPQGMVALDEDAGIVWSNQRARELLRMPPRHTGHPLAAYVTWENGNEIWSGLSRLWNIPGGQGEAREFLARRSGRRHFGILSTVSLPGGERAGAVLTVLEKGIVSRILAVAGGLTVVGAFTAIMGQSQGVLGALHMARMAAESAAPVLICGERGTGKTLFARAIHNAAATPGPFVSVDCVAVPRSCLEAELFGMPEYPGRLELAHEGVLFLDNIEGMSLPVQDRLMRFLRSGALRRPEFSFSRTTDADATPSAIPAIPVQVRLMAATSASLQEAVHRHRFRPDLYYRLSPFTVSVPPLRERVEDIPTLTTHFITQVGAGLNRSFLPLSPKTEAVLKAYPWPGNVRELELAVERALYLSSGTLLPEHFGLPSHIDQSVVALQEPQTMPVLVDDPEIPLHEMELRLIRSRLQHFANNYTRAAASLGMSRPTLYRKLR